MEISQENFCVDIGVQLPVKTFAGSYSVSAKKKNVQAWLSLTAQKLDVLIKKKGCGKKWSFM